MTDVGLNGWQHQRPAAQVKKHLNPRSCLEGREEDISVKELLATWIRDAKNKHQEDIKEKRILQEEVKALWEQIGKLLKQVSALTISWMNSGSLAGTPTWASVAASSSGLSPHLLASQGRPVAALPLKKAREIIIRVKDKEDTKTVQSKSPEQILQAIKTAMPKQGEQIALIRRLPSGDIALHAVSINARAQLKRETEWCKRIAASSTVMCHQFPVLIHSIHIMLNTRNQEIIKRLMEENVRLHPGLEILQVAWSKKIYQSDKTYSSLIVEVASEAMTNHLLDHGFLELFQEHDCEYFE